MRKHSKRWLMSRMQTSGSERSYVQNGAFADTRNAKSSLDIEELPQHESIKSTRKFYNGKINAGLLVRFLRGKIGANWDDVYSEIIARIPTALLDYKHMIFWFVAKDVEVVEGELWDKGTQKIIWQEGLVARRLEAKEDLDFESFEFYVDPNTNQLKHIQQKSYQKKMSIS